jgi:hypothetical protein
MTEYVNNREKIELLVRMLRDQFDGGGCVIALFPVNDNEWGMSVAMSENTPVVLLEQLSDALVMGKFEISSLKADEQGNE